MKANDKQREVLTILGGHFLWLANCNDIDSPSARISIENDLISIENGLSIDEADDLIDSFRDVLQIIKQI